MRQLYVFTAGEASAREHLNDSIKRSVSSNLLDEYLTREDAVFYKSLFTNSEGFNAWGAVPGPRNRWTWESMQAGDVVLTVYSNHYRFVSTVISKLHNAELAERIWGIDPDGQTWEYMYFLTEPKPVEIHVSSKPVVDYLNNGYRGFTKISDERTAKLRKVYGSLEAFLEQVFHVPLPPSIIEHELEAAEVAADESNNFDPENLVDGRKKVIAEVVRRRGQPKFRKILLEAYGGRCAVTGCQVETVLEAAHIIPYAGDKTNHVNNGILLRADIHTLFDLGEIKIDSEGVVKISDSLEGTEYAKYLGEKMRFPDDLSKAPHKNALSRKFNGNV